MTTINICVRFVLLTQLGIIQSVRAIRFSVDSKCAQMRVIWALEISNDWTAGGPHGTSPSLYLSLCVSRPFNALRYHCGRR